MTALADVHVERLPLALVFAITVAGFLLIYFGVGGLTHLLVTRVFPRLGVGRRSPTARWRPGRPRARSASRWCRSRSSAATAW